LPGEPSQAVVVRCAAIESPYPAVKGRSASKLPVFAPGRVALPNATPNLNIGMDFWSASPAVPAVQEEASRGLAVWHWPGVIVLLSWYDWTRPETDYIVCTIAIDCLLIRWFC